MANKPNLLTEFPDIAKEWDSEKNKDLKPEMFTHGSEAKVWWKCEQRHSYEMRISDKVGGYKCPICSGRKVLPGYNDLTTTHPEIAKEWDYSKNGSLTPQDVSKGSETKVWWKCKKGHSYEARVANRINGTGCPICSGRKVLPGYNDLATTHPDIAQEWDYFKNGSLTPQDVSKGSNKKVWWKCNQRHSYVASVNKRTNGTGCPICSGKKILPGYNDLATVYPEIAKKWDYEKNRSLTPQDVSKESHKKVWWKCEQGHSYEMQISDKVRGYKCPICSGQKTLPGYNDLVTTHPEIAKEWNYEKNGSLTPQNVSKGCNKKVWWLCKQGHSYKQSPNDKTRGRGCPICSNKKVLPGYNDLATTHPEIAKEWDYERNGSLTPQEVPKGRNKKVWWKCAKEHSWKATIASRTRGNGCPYCSNQKVLPGYNDLATTHPEIAKEWDYSKNGSLTPQSITKGSNKKVWWLCEQGHSYKQSPNVKTNQNCGCPYCSNQKVLPGYNDLATTHPEIAKEWNYEKNGSLTPQNVSKGCNKKVWWLCKQEHSYKQSPNSRTRGRGCPYCSMSTGEKTVYKVLNDLNLKYQIQVTFDDLIGIDGGKLRYDFGIYENNKLLFLIEYQGTQHYYPKFGGEKQLEKQQFHDDLKREYAENHNIPLLEIPYEITEYADIFSCIKNFYDHTFKN